ncbi:MAG: L-threonylcarbamoyladenylate synthase, partial [Rhodomicrobium sp.]
MIVTASDQHIAEAARILREGGLVAFPSETVYGLGADATNGRAVATIFEAKGRPRFNPLIVHIANLAAASDLAVFDNSSLSLAEKFWPGPLTLVLPRRPGVPISELVTAGLDTIAIRVPAHPVAQRLLEEAEIPIAAPSANISGRVSPTCAAHVEEDLGNRISLILDGGSTQAGVESTIIGMLPSPALLRAGAVAREDIERQLKCKLSDTHGSEISAPGQLVSHYAPRATLRLQAAEARPGEMLLAFGPNAPEGTMNLSRSGDLREAAANLFAYLRALDALGSPQIAVM